MSAIDPLPLLQHVHGESLVCGRQHVQPRRDDGRIVAGLLPLFGQQVRDGCLKQSSQTSQVLQRWRVLTAFEPGQRLGIHSQTLCQLSLSKPKARRRFPMFSATRCSSASSVVCVSTINVDRLVDRYSCSRLLVVTESNLLTSNSTLVVDAGVSPYAR